MKVITIDRQFGAGGHSIGREVAKRLGIEFYDKDIIREAASAGGMEADLIIREEEHISPMNAFIHAISPVAYDDKDEIFALESKAIVKYASMGPCVILGRCGTAILKDAGIDCFSIFLHADEQKRAARVGEITGLTDPKQIRHAMHKRDTARKGYVECYTSSHWGDAREYTMTLDTGAIGFDACVESIIAAVGC